MTHWGNGYFECDRGKFEAALVKDGREVCYTESETIQIGRGYKPSDKAIVTEYSEWYGFRIDW